MQMRGVFDTNVIVSSLLVGGVPLKALDKLLDKGTVLISIPFLLELADVLGREKFNRYLTQDERMRFLVSFVKEAEMIEIIETINICRDRKDNMLLELAASGDADYLITGDRDLLVLNPFRGMEILTPREFFDKVIGK